MRSYKYGHIWCVRIMITINLLYTRGLSKQDARRTAFAVRTSANKRELLEFASAGTSLECVHVSVILRTRATTFIHIIMQIQPQLSRKYQTHTQCAKTHKHTKTRHTYTHRAHYTNTRRRCRARDGVTTQYTCDDDDCIWYFTFENLFKQILYIHTLESHADLRIYCDYLCIRQLATLCSRFRLHCATECPPLYRFFRDHIYIYRKSRLFDINGLLKQCRR